MADKYLSIITNFGCHETVEGDSSRTIAGDTKQWLNSKMIRPEHFICRKR